MPESKSQSQPVDSVPISELERLRTQVSELQAMVTSCLDQDTKPTAPPLLRPLIESIPTGVLLIQGDRVYLNRLCEQLVGYTNGELPTLEKWLDALYGPKAGEIKLLCAKILLGLEPTYQVLQIRCKDRTRRLIEFTGSRQGTEELWLLRDVTEQIAANQRAKSSEARIHQVLENMPVMLSAVGEDGNFIIWNRECERVTGYRADEVVGNPGAWELLYPDFHHREKLIHEMQSLGNDYYHLEWEVCCKDGTMRTVSGSNISARVPIEGWKSWGVAVDVTDRKRLETALRESESRFRLAAEAVNGVIYDYTCNGQNIFRSQGLFDLVGFHPSELAPQLEAWIERVHSDDREAVRTQFQAALKNAEHFDMEYRVLHKENRYVQVWDKALVVRDRRAKVERVVGLAVDVTAQKEAGEFLRQLANERTELLDRLQMILDRMPVGCLLCNSEFRLSYWNEAAKDIFGYEMDEVRGKLPGEVIAPVVRRSHSATLFERLARGENDLQVIEEHVNRHGATVICHWNCCPLYDANGKFVGVLAMCQDITEHRRNEEKLKLQEAELAHISRLTTMGEMVAGIAHEITQPLQAIGSYAGACSSMLDTAEFKGVESLREWSQKIAELSSRGGDIIWRLRRFARKADSDRVQFDLNALVRESLEMVHFESDQHAIDLEMDLQCPEMIVADRVQIQQVLINLLRNAIEATKQQPAPRSIVVRTVRDKQEAIISVEDNGPGVTLEAAAKLFQPFHTTKPHGMGIGLPISRSIVEAHQGRIWNEPCQPRGVAFRFSLPIQPDEQVTPLDAVEL